MTIGGGEPTVRKDLDEIIRLAVRRRFRAYRLVTNGVNMTEPMARSLKRAGLRIAQVSLDGACEETHDKVRGKGNWARSLQGIAALKKAGIFVILSYVVLPEINMSEAPQLLDLVQKLGVAGAKFARPGAGGTGLRPQGRYRRGLLDRVQPNRRACHPDPLQAPADVFRPPGASAACPGTRRTKGLWGLATDLCQCDNTELIEVNGSTGDVYYCRIRHKLGNIWEQDLTELWRSHPVLVALRRKTPAALAMDAAPGSPVAGDAPPWCTATPGWS